MNDFTLMLNAASHGNDHSAAALLPMVYDELRKLAYARMAKESAGHTLQPTALVHEAWLRLVDSEERSWQNRAYFFSAAATAMRRILVEYARRKTRLKHGGGQHRMDVDGLELSVAGPDDKILMVEEALQQLEAVNPQRAQVVVMKYFGGMTNKEVAQTLEIGERSVDRHWACAKTWLYDKIQLNE